MICKPCQNPHTPEQCKDPISCPCQHRERVEPTEAPTADPKDC